MDQKRLDMLEGGGSTTTSESEQLATSNPSRSEVHWFDDGNIILQAGSRLFKVHRGVLSKHSTIFRDMFSLPQSLDQESTPAEFEGGGPLVVLADSQQDVHHFLSAIYNP